MRNINSKPVLIEFNRPEEKGVDLKQVVIALMKSHSQLILAFPEGSIAPDINGIVDANVGIMYSGVVQYTIDNTKHMVDKGLMDSGDIVYPDDSAKAQEMGFNMLYFIYNQYILGNYGLVEDDYTKCINSTSREDRRANRGLISRLATYLQLKRSSESLLGWYAEDLTLHLHIQKYGRAPDIK